MKNQYSIDSSIEILNQYTIDSSIEVLNLVLLCLHTKDLTERQELSSMLYSVKHKTDYIIIDFRNTLGQDHVEVVSMVNQYTSKVAEFGYDIIHKAENVDQLTAKVYELQLIAFRIKEHVLLIKMKSNLDSLIKLLSSSDIVEPANAQPISHDSTQNTYIYHGTGTIQALNIQRVGYLEACIIGKVKPVILFTTELWYARHLAVAKVGFKRYAVLRTKLANTFSLLVKGRNNNGDEYITYNNVPLCSLEIQADDGNWYLLDKWNVLKEEPLGT